MEEKAAKAEEEEEAGDIDDPLAMLGGMGQEEVYKVTQFEEAAAEQSEAQRVEKLVAAAEEDAKRRAVAAWKEEAGKKPEPEAEGQGAPAAQASGPSAGQKEAAKRTPPVAAKGKDADSGTCIFVTILILISLCVLGVMAYVLGLGSYLGFGVGEHELTKASWDEATAGRTVFVKFFAPWCGHCKRMKPDWDRLIADYTNSSVLLVADVDCIGAGKSLCDEVGIRGFPTLKYGDPSDLQDYKGGRSYRELSKFAGTLGPMCGPAFLDLCSEEKKAQIAEFQAMGARKREELIKEKDAVIAKIESDFKAMVDGLSKTYKEAQATKDEAVKRIKDSGLGLLKAVATHQAEAASKADDRTADL